MVQDEIPLTRILVLHGPNLNLLGEREPEVYGSTSLSEIDDRIASLAEDRRAGVRAVQSNSEGELIDAVHDAGEWADGIIVNPGAYTHTSYALRDALAAVDLPTIEVHLSNVDAREEFRRKSVLAPVCAGRVSGFGWRSYTLALEGLLRLLEEA